MYLIKIKPLIEQKSFFLISIITEKRKEMKNILLNDINLNTCCSIMYKKKKEFPIFDCNNKKVYMLVLRIIIFRTKKLFVFE